MIVNGTDMTKKYGKSVMWLKQMIQPRTIVTFVNWIDNVCDPQKYRDNSYREFDIYIELLIIGENASEYELVRSNLLQDLDSGRIHLDGMEFSHDFCMKSENITQLNETKCRYEITLTGFNKLGEQQNIRFTGTTYQFYVSGTENTPAILTLSSNIGLNSLTVEGLTEESITINQVQKDSVIVIDGENCMITENGENIFKKTDLWEFPKISPGTATITLSSECTAQLTYYPRYK